MSIAHHCGVSHMLLKSEGLFNTAISMLQDVRTYEGFKGEKFISLNGIPDACFYYILFVLHNSTHRIRQ